MFEDYFIPCPIKRKFGIDCPGCGLQRSIDAILEGDFYSSFICYPPTIPILLFFLFAAAAILFKFKNGLRYIHRFFYFNLILIGLNYAYKCFQGSIFL